MICAFSAQIIRAQDIIPRFENLNINNGLPHSSVYGIYQDKKGFIWFSTAEGLCRYDGNTLQTFLFTAPGKAAVTDNLIRKKCLEDKQHNIWYSTESGIYKWNVLTEQVEQIKGFPRAMFGNSGFDCLSIDENDCLWIFNIVRGIFVFNTKTRQLKNYPMPFGKDNNIKLKTRAHADSEGNIWFRIVTAKDRYFYFNRHTATYSLQFDKDTPDYILSGKDKTVLCYNGKIVFIENKTGKRTVVKKEIDGKPVSFYSVECVKDTANRYWFTSQNSGIFCYDEPQKKFIRYHHDNSKIKSLPFDITTGFFIDHGNNLWIGTDGGGVAKIDLKQPRFNIFPLSDGDHRVLKDYFTKCFYEDEKRRIWFGTHSSGLNIYDPRSGKLINFQHKAGDLTSLPGNTVGAIIKDNDGNIWVGSSGGISLFDSKTLRFTTIPVLSFPFFNPEESGLINKMIVLKNGDKLVATVFGLVRIKKRYDGSFSGVYIAKDKANGNTVDIAEMDDGSIYAALPAIGMYRLTSNGNSYDVDKLLLPRANIRSIRKDEVDKTYLWIGTAIGLIHYNTADDTYKRWNEPGQIPNSLVYGALEDEKHDLWISSNKGLCYFNRGKESFENYTYLDGLQSNEFNTQSFYKSNTGTLYFGGIKGFNWFSTFSDSNSLQKPVAAITRIDINDVLTTKTTPYFSNQQIEAASDKNDFRFFYTALDYTRPESNRVQYTLEGWDVRWFIASAGSVRYSNLPPGHYVFRVKVSNDHNTWSDEEKVFVYIRWPFWQQTWFIVLVLATLIFLVVYITYLFAQRKIKSKLRDLERQHAIDSERNRISRDMHDEIGSGLTHIALLSEMIQTQQINTPGIQKKISIISASARRLVTEISEIIWAMNTHNDSLENLLAYIREQMQQRFEPLHMYLHIDFPDEIPAIKLSNAQRRNLYLVTKEALNNAVKHAGTDKFFLSCSINGSAVVFTVSDKGSGLGEVTSSPVSGNGLNNMRKRMEDIGGTFELESKNGGLTVRYSLPLTVTGTTFFTSV